MPESLGGNLIVDRAACESCEKRINLFEQNILKTVLYAPRVHLGIRRKRRKRDEDALTVNATVDGKDIKLRLAVKHVPVWLFFPVLDSPGAFTDRPRDFNAMRGMWIKNFERSPGIPHGLQAMASPVLDTFKFTQFLAKIAHAYAASVLGTAFLPLLREIILEEQRSQNFHLIGGSPETAPTLNLHELSLDWRALSGIEYLVTKIRLFANLGAPTYEVIAGRRCSSRPNEDGV